MRTISDTLGQQVSAALEQQILAGMLAPGQRLNADELASEFGVSRIPVREALRSLNASGWIEIRPRHGAFVRRRSLREPEDLFHVRAMLEAEASRLAAKNRTEAQLELIAQAHRIRNSFALELAVFAVVYTLGVWVWTSRSPMAGCR